MIPYVVLAALLCVLTVPLVWRALHGRLDPFEPLVIFALAYGAMFVARPLAMFLGDDLSYARSSRTITVDDTLVQVVWIALAGAVAFVVAYHLPCVRRPRRRRPSYDPRRVVWMATIAAATGLAASLVLAWRLAQEVGDSFLIAALAGRSSDLSNVVADSSKYLAQASLLCVPASLVLLSISRARRSRGAMIIGLLALLGFALRASATGSRGSLLPLAGGGVVYWYLARETRPCLATLLGVATAALLVSTVVLHVRGAIDRMEALRQVGADLRERPLSIFDPITIGPDAEMAAAFAAVLTAVPDQIPFMRGGAVLGDLVTRPIPRQWWLDKPLPPREQIISTLWPAEYSDVGVKTANPEFSALLFFYLDFGVLGVIAGMALYGRLARRIFEWVRREPDRVLPRLIFSISLPLLVFVLRDSPVDALVRFVFTLVPIWLVFRLARVPAPRRARSVETTPTALRTAAVLVFALLVASPSLAAPPLPFDLPSPGVLAASPHKVFAHYFPPFPISLDDRDGSRDYYATQYLSPDGEGGKYRDMGGYLRQRPLPRPPLGADWQVRDLENEVRRAAAIGLDGFACDILAASGPQWDRVLHLLEAARRAEPTFRVLLVPDLAGALGREPERVVDVVARLAKHPATFRLPDGRVVLAPFDAQRRPSSWWAAQVAALKERGIDVALVPILQGWRRHAADFAPISAGLSSWGPRTPSAARALRDEPAAARTYAPLWMAPVAPQDFRPKGFEYWEAANSETYRAMWEAAIGGEADWVQVITWNDYSEGTEIAPSTGTQWAFYDLTAYYVAWFKTGRPPTVARDTLYYFHRSQPTTAVFDRDRQPQAFRSRGGEAPRDEVELVALLSSPGVLEIDTDRSYRRAAGAGMTSLRAPLAPGRPRFRLERDGATVIALESAWPVVDRVVYQDLLYRGGSSSRSVAAP